MTVDWDSDTMLAALQRIDAMRAEVVQSHQTINALVIELARLRLQAADLQERLEAAEAAIQ